MRRARKSRTYFQDVREAETLEKLRRCEDIIFDWEDWNAGGLRLVGEDRGRLRASSRHDD